MFFSLGKMRLFRPTLREREEDLLGLKSRKNFACFLLEAISRHAKRNDTEHDKKNFFYWINFFLRDWIKSVDMIF